MLRKIVFTFVVAAALAAGGCGGQQKEDGSGTARDASKDAAQPGGAAAPAPDPAATTPAPAADQTGAPAAGAATGGVEVQLAGTLGCGHCNFHATSDCAAVVKTASGELYVLDGVDEKSALWEKRLEPGHTITLAGKVVGNDPVKHVTMTSFELD